MAHVLEFPRLVHKGTEKRRVNNKAEFDAAVKDGFAEHADPPKGSPADKGEKVSEPAPVDIPTPVSVNSAPDNIEGDVEQSKAVVEVDTPKEPRGPGRPKAKE